MSFVLKITIGTIMFPMTPRHMIMMQNTIDVVLVYAGMTGLLYVSLSGRNEKLAERLVATAAVTASSVNGAAPLDVTSVVIGETAAASVEIISSRNAALNASA